MTLIELLIVMSLLSLVMGAGVGMLASLDPGAKAAVGVARNLIRSARNSAVARTAPARVRIDRAHGLLVAEALAVVGTWHFEKGSLAGALGLDGGVFGAEEGTWVGPGYMGEGAVLAQLPPDAGLHFPVQEDPAYDLSDGFAVELAVRRDAVGSARLLSVGRSVLVEAPGDGSLAAYFVPRLEDEMGSPVPGGKVWVRSAPGVLPLGRWARVRLDYDRRRLRAVVDGVVVAAVEEDAPVWPVEDPLILGGGQAAFPGALDCLVISAVSGTERTSLPAGVQLASDAPPQVAFAPGGALDREVHPSPVELGFEYDDGRREVVRVSLYGTVE